MRVPALDRRTLLIGGGTGAGLVLAFALWPRRDAPLPVTRHDERAFNAFLKIGTDGRVTVAVPQVETGQGAWTGLAQIAADELGAAIEQVGVEPAPPGPAYANVLMGGARLTAGATSIRAFEAPLRHAAAAARAMLMAAAADRWGVAAAECDVVGGQVVHEGKSVPIGLVAEAAARGSVPADPPLRAPGRGAIAGRSVARFDSGAKADGSWRFAGDVRLPGMAFAAARLAPPSGRLAAHDPDAARRRPGVLGVYADADGIAVLGDTGWSAREGLRAAAPRFEGPAGDDAPALVEALARALDQGPIDRLFERGDYAGAVADARPLAATYRLAPALHLGLEPLSAAARWRGGRVEVWAASQAPDLARQRVAQAAGIDPSAVTFYPMGTGDPTGRAVEADAAPLAALLARHAGRPVSLSLGAAGSTHQDRPRPPLVARMTALAEQGVRIAAWKARLAGAPGLGAALDRLHGRDDATLAPMGSAAVPPYSIPVIRVEAARTDRARSFGYMKGGDAALAGFVTESFVDEVARALGQEPLAFRMAMLGGNLRLAKALESVAALGGWDGGGPGSSKGLAAASLDGSHIALLADARIEGGRIRLSRLVAVVDCGRAVNPALVRQQVEAALIMEWHTAQAPMPQLVGGLVRHRPLGASLSPALADPPEVVVELLPSGAAPGGVSALGHAVLAAAVANAIAAGSGLRLRNLPFDPMSAA